MAAWDEIAGHERPRGTGSWTQRQSDRLRLWPFWVAACAALVVAATLLTSRTGGDDINVRVAGTPGSLIQDELVLVPEVDRVGPLSLMRVRMTRREFSRLGVPITDPQGDGFVDVEVLVGEDGVARSIRRAVAVGSPGPTR